MLRTVCYKHYIQTFYLLNDFVCVLLAHDHLYNNDYTLCICIYQCEYSYAHTVNCQMNNYFHTVCTNSSFHRCAFSLELSKKFSLETVRYTRHLNMALACHHVDTEFRQCYQLQFLLEWNTHLYNMHDAKQN